MTAPSPDSAITFTQPNLLKPNENNPGTGDDDYYNTVNLDLNKVSLPSAYISQGWPSSVSGLLSLFSNNTDLGSCQIYLNVNGTAGSHNCACRYVLMASGSMSDGSTINSKEFAAVNDSVNISSGGNATTFDGKWMPIQSYGTLVFPTTITVTQTTNGRDGCWCGGFYNSDDPTAGWNACQIGLKVVLTVQTVNWCTLPNTNNVGMDLCYNFLSDYNVNSWKVGVSPGQQITTAVQNYCQNKYPNATLQDLLPCTLKDTNDCNICACNMKQEDYQEYMISVTDQVSGTPPGIMPNCLFPPCKQSTFIEANLDGCPGPDCINVVAMNSNDVQGNISINQNSGCSTYNTGQANTGEGGKGSDEGWSTWQKVGLGFCILGVVILLVLIALAAWGGEKSGKGKGNQPVDKHDRRSDY